MCPAPRKPVNRGLEPNLHWHPTKGPRWKNPRTGKYHYLGLHVSREDANVAVRQLNLKFAAKSEIFDRIASSESESLRTVIEIHIREKLPASRVAQRTKDTRRYALNKIAQSSLASCDISTITTRDVVEYLDSLPTASMRQQYRGQLHAVFKTAIQRGLLDNNQRNPVADTDTPYVERERDRLTEEGYRAIYDLAAPWLRNLMDLMRLTLQRPDDLVKLRWESFNGTHIQVQQGKSKKRLAIIVRPDIREVLQRCRSSDIASPFIVHRLPERIKAANQRSKARGHHTQILRSQASREFAALVQRCEHFAGQENPPTLYECKSLGVAQLRQQGWSLEDTQRLAGHSTARMTQHYAEGHEAPFDIVGMGPPMGPRSVTQALP